jgi:DNA replication protein DnaC
MTKTSELAHLFRQLKAPAAARALAKLAQRAREEQWSYERFAEALLSTEVASGESHGGESRIKAARFPARKTLEEFDFTFQRSVKKQVIEHLGQMRGGGLSARRSPRADCVRETLFDDRDVRERLCALQGLRVAGVGF